MDSKIIYKFMTSDEFRFPKNEREACHQLSAKQAGTTAELSALSFVGGHLKFHGI